MWIWENWDVKLQKADDGRRKGGRKAQSPRSIRLRPTSVFALLRRDRPARQEVQSRGDTPSAATGPQENPGDSHYGLTRSRSLGSCGPLASHNGAPALAKCFPLSRLSLSRHPNLSPVGSFTPVQSAETAFAIANPFRHFPSGSNPKWLKSQDLQCELHPFSYSLWQIRHRESETQSGEIRPDPSKSELFRPVSNKDPIALRCGGPVKVSASTNSIRNMTARRARTLSQARRACPRDFYVRWASESIVVHRPR